MRTFSLLVASLGLTAGALALSTPSRELLDSWSYSDCGLETDPIQIDSIEVSPDPPVPGQNLTVIAKGQVTEVIEEGAYADVSVNLGLIDLPLARFDLCEAAQISNASIQCSVQPGPYTLTQTVDLPKEIPKAIFNVNVRGYTAEDEDMLCLKLRVDFIEGPI